MQHETDARLGDLWVAWCRLQGINPIRLPSEETHARFLADLTLISPPPTRTQGEPSDLPTQP